MTNASFVRRVLLVAAVALLALLFWRLLHLVVLLFGAVVGAVVLRGLAARFERHLRVPARASLIATVLGIVALFGLIGWWIGEPLSEQFALLRERIPEAVEKLNAWLRTHRLGSIVLQDVEQMKNGEFPWARAAGLAGLTLGALGSALLMIVMAIYLAAEPRLYHNGLLRLLPPLQRPRIDAALRESAVGLRRWLKGQALSMLFIGSSTALGLAALGVPLAPVLGLVSGVLAFVPFFGALVGGLLAVLVAFINGPQAALHAALLLLAIQQAEEYFVTPQIQRRAVRLPPVLGLAAAVVFGTLFGIGGVLLATPMMVVVMILVRRLYVEDTLERRLDAT